MVGDNHHYIFSVGDMWMIKHRKKHKCAEGFEGYIITNKYGITFCTLCGKELKR